MSCPKDYEVCILSTIKETSDPKKEIMPFIFKFDVINYYIDVRNTYENLSDSAYFYYSLSGYVWNKIGNKLKLEYTIPHFVGYRFGLFNYATKEIGGYVDFDYFRIEQNI